MFVEVHYFFYFFILIQYFLEHGIRNEQHQQFVEVNKKKRHNEPLFFYFYFLGCSVNHYQNKTL